MYYHVTENITIEVANNAGRHVIIGPNTAAIWWPSRLLLVEGIASDPRRGR